MFARLNFPQSRGCFDSMREAFERRIWESRDSGGEGIIMVGALRFRL